MRRPALPSKVPVNDGADSAPEVAVSARAPRETTEAIEIDLLLQGIHRRWGYDFTHYSQASVRRRLELAMRSEGALRYTQLLDSLLHDEAAFDRFLRYMSVTVTDMFRDPAFYKSVREKLIPALKTYPFVKIWCAGCATGEEVYSLAILLQEEGFLDRARIYATDFNNHSLDIAQKGVYPIRHFENYAANYRDSGGERDFAGYYNTGYDFAKIKDFLKARITFSYHNLVTDGVFGEMNLITCRNVMIYFDRSLQSRVLTLFSDSLRHGAFLCLGAKETLNHSVVRPLFEAVDLRQKIYRKNEVNAHG